jgi:hypothetical protein
VSYDEEAELTRYVWRYHLSLLSRFEWDVERAAHAREKLADDTGENDRRVLERFGRLGDSRIDVALAEGREEFRGSACRRILTEHSELRINRCPRCPKVLRTPAAMQCFWCGCDWHNANS